jgi:hypothetical protein
MSDFNQDIFEKLSALPNEQLQLVNDYIDALLAARGIVVELVDERIDNPPGVRRE